jgi:hypothetical protein
MLIRKPEQPPSGYVGMETALGYRIEAQRNRELAKLAASEVTRAELLNVAEQFEQLADLVEREREEDPPSDCAAITTAAISRAMVYGYIGSG